jgi:endonuclease YncB( thermonuclease family)
MIDGDTLEMRGRRGPLQGIEPPESGRSQESL